MSPSNTLPKSRKYTLCFSHFSDNADDWQESRVENNDNIEPWSHEAQHATVEISIMRRTLMTFWIMGFLMIESHMNASEVSPAQILIASCGCWYSCVWLHIQETSFSAQKATRPQFSREATDDTPFFKKNFHPRWRQLLIARLHFPNAVIKPGLQSSSSHLALIYREIIVQIILVQINWVN